MIDFLDFSYLSRGNERQKTTYRLLSELKIMEILQLYAPVIAGTIPIGIDVESSDIDILCCYDDPGEFEKVLKRHFSEQEGFKPKSPVIRGRESRVAAFVYSGERFEVFGQSLPVQEQDGFIHMLVEYRLLQLCNDRFRDEIKEVKRKGMHTEPAFARLLRIETDPYRTLLGFVNLSDWELRNCIPELYRKR